MARKPTHTPKKKWQPLRRVEMAPNPNVPDDIDVNWVMYQSDRYTVLVEMMEPDRGMAGMLHLSIRHTDRRKAARDWRHFQRIKNELAGPEREAMELFPAESRLVDESNQFHLWVAAEGDTIPAGYHGDRQVSGPEVAEQYGAAQRSFDDDTPVYYDAPNGEDQPLIDYLERER